MRKDAVAQGAIAANRRQPGIRTRWGRSCAIYDDDFEKVVETLLRETDARPDADGEAQP